MSVDDDKYHCDYCGHTESQCEGIYLFSDKCYTMLQAMQTGKYNLVVREYDQRKGLSSMP